MKSYYNIDNAVNVIVVVRLPVNLLHAVKYALCLMFLFGMIVVRGQDTTCGYNCQTSTQLIASGVTSYQNGDSATALLYFNDAQKLLYTDDITPLAALLYSTRGDIYRERGLYKRALQDYAFSLIRRETYEAFAGRAWVWYILGDYDAAYRDFTSAMRLQPNNGVYSNLRGLILVAQGQYKRAVNEFGRAIRVDADQAEVYIFYKNHGDVYALMGNPTNALADYDSAIAENPYYIKAYLARAALAFAQKRYEDAQNDCLRVLQLEPNNVYALLNNGIILFHLGRVTESQASILQATSLDERFGPAFYWRGVLAFIQGDTAAAEASFNTTLQLEPSFATAYYDRGYLYIQEGKYAEAIRDFSQYLTVIPGSAASYYYRGLARFQQGRFNLALEDYTEAIRLAPSMDAAYINRSLTYEALKQPVKAANDLAKAKELPPFFKDAYVYNDTPFYLMARYEKLSQPSEPDLNIDLKAAQQWAASGQQYLDQQRYVLAIVDYTNALAINPRTLAAYMGRGSAYMSLGRTQDALGDYTRLLTLQPTNTAALQARGDAYAVLGDTRRAADDYLTYKAITGKLEPGMQDVINKAR